MSKTWLSLVYDLPLMQGPIPQSNGALHAPAPGGALRFACHDSMPSAYDRRLSNSASMRGKFAEKA
jgi:hypothetical protein